MLKARGIQLQMILFPMERGRNALGCRITEFTNLTYLIHLFDIFLY
jgi:hypothetical protein